MPRQSRARGAPLRQSVWPMEDYDEFGNYIGPALDDDEDGDEEAQQLEVCRAHHPTLTHTPPRCVCTAGCRRTRAAQLHRAAVHRRSRASANRR